ncbi:carboxypeptidase regulatory-like domain-containing protein [Microbacterium sp. M28]|uniref:carboxypeptidase regulatory-like domain-containing protein n=1 Tax=Microbacterium sp. M28 TaxID=2962064 RepID=UPI0021F3F301|nr:carboxypeptidase regulatory-like domain-containing protein [Microbacterium sp. M28]UYO97667.1 carboxypeptidase regulatory-like domain-containing protein [Microbacterium sp. M28]
MRARPPRTSATRTASTTAPPAVAGKPSCTGDAADVPTWDPDALTLTGNTQAIDTSGAAAWFEPTVSLSSLTIEFTRRSGFPVYQTWFSVFARDITGTVTDTDAAAPVEGATLTLTDANGDTLATTTSGPGGAYAFPGQIATDGYTVTVTPPTGQIAVVGSGTADLRSADAVVDLSVRDIVPVAVSGTVRDSDGNPVPGATVTIPRTPVLSRSRRALTARTCSTKCRSAHGSPR